MEHFTANHHRCAACPVDLLWLQAAFNRDDPWLKNAPCQPELEPVFKFTNDRRESKREGQVFVIDIFQSAGRNSDFAVGLKETYESANGSFKDARIWIEQVKIIGRFVIIRALKG